MKNTFKSKQSLVWGLLGLFIFSGTYNAIVINSQSGIQGQHISFSKRLDELYGEMDSKREIAAAIQWQKLSTKQAAIHKKVIVKKKIAKVKKQTESNNSESTSSAVAPNAAVREELSLNLVAVSNPKIWQQGINNSDFSGSLETNSGVIESLDVNLPNGGVSVSFSEMTGNVFEYDLDGELYAGMMYQESATTYVVNLSNGPLAGTKLTFAREMSYEDKVLQEDQAIELAQAQEADAGAYREEIAQTPEPTYNETNPYIDQGISYDEQLQQQALAEQQILSEQQAQI